MLINDKVEGILMNLNNIMLGTEDSKRLADFYTKVVGEPAWHDSGNGWYGFAAGNGSIAIGPHSEVKGANPSPGRIILNFETEDVRAEFERIKELGAKVIAEPYQPEGSEGMWLATFADPDGNYFQLSTPWEQ